LPSNFRQRIFSLLKSKNAIIKYSSAIKKSLIFIKILALSTALAVPNNAFSGPTKTASNSLKSMVDFRDENLIRQLYDFSCGAAALATILRYGFGDPVTEQQIVTDLFAGLDGAEASRRKKEGFSLYDLRQVAQRRGYRAEGFKLEPQYLAQLNGPVLVFIETMGYKHFAVLKGVRGDRVYLADPSRGNIRMPVYRFLDAWMRDGTGIVFVIEPDGDQTNLTNVLRPNPEGVVQPEILAVRELLAVRAPFTTR